ncbi:MAG: hypothetical protein DMF48_05975 [Verrucomicrobia bacterium]|nr:MAG: hypothetical protein DMF48_05975 [Verrucomicrobiota bacterium]
MGSRHLFADVEGLNRYSVTSVAEENAIRRRICVASRIRDAEYGLFAHGNLAAASPPPLQRQRSCIVSNCVGFKWSTGAV